MSSSSFQLLKLILKIIISKSIYDELSIEFLLSFGTYRALKSRKYFSNSCQLIEVHEKLE